MNPQLSQQDLAAFAISERLEIQWRYIGAPGDRWEKDNNYLTPTERIRLDQEIRIAPGALNEWNLPHGVQPHNPDGLTPEQITEGGYRAVTFEELDFRHKGLCEAWVPYEGKFKGPASGYQSGYTYRVPITTPLPPVKESLTPQPATGQSKTPRTISEYFGQPEGSFKVLIQQHEASGYSPEEIAIMGGITGVLKSRKEQVERLQTELTAALAERDEARRLLTDAAKWLASIIGASNGVSVEGVDLQDACDTLKEIQSHLAAKHTVSPNASATE